jgi:hypothetical protein
LLLVLHLLSHRVAHSQMFRRLFKLLICPFKLALQRLYLHHC